MQMTKDLYWVKNQIVVLNVVGSNPTGHPPKVLEIIEFQGLFLYYPANVISSGAVGVVERSNPQTDCLRRSRIPPTLTPSGDDISAFVR